uniref:Uncharacterized protein n=1 Tax=Anopheles albimanus TaxID=7167 RepID=A0A182F4D9_ANOAL
MELQIHHQLTFRSLAALRGTTDRRWIGDKCYAFRSKRQHMGGWTTAAANAKQNVPYAASSMVLASRSATTSPERLRGATHDLFELLERVQCSRLDDQRCVLPPYFTQVRALLPLPSVLIRF